MGGNGKIASREEALDAVGRDGWMLKFIPEELKTEAVCMAAVKQNGAALHWAPDAVKTEAMCLEAVRQDGIAFADVPERLRTPAVCALAVENSRWTLPGAPGGRTAGKEDAGRKA